MIDLTGNSGELKPCPFCGHLPDAESLGEDGYYIQCSNIECQCVDALDPDAWNKRPIESFLWSRIAAQTQLLRDVVRLTLVIDRWLAKGNIEPLWYECLAEICNRATIAIGENERTCTWVFDPGINNFAPVWIAACGFEQYYDNNLPHDQECFYCQKCGGKIIEVMPGRKEDDDARK